VEHVACIVAATGACAPEIFRAGCGEKIIDVESAINLPTSRD
jgi:hypothetical protein